MEAVAPRKPLIDATEAHDPKTSSKGSRPANPLQAMLWVDLMQPWSDLSDPAMEDALIEVPKRAALVVLAQRVLPPVTSRAQLSRLEGTASIESLCAAWNPNPAGGTPWS